MLNDNQISPELKTYLNEIYDDVLPKEFIELFKKAIFHVPPSIHGLHTKTIRDICKTDNADLTRRQVGICQDIIRACQPYLLYSDLNEAMKMQEQIEQVSEKFNVGLSIKQRELDNERRNRQSLLSGNGLHKIN